MVVEGGKESSKTVILLLNFDVVEAQVPHPPPAGREDYVLRHKNCFVAFDASAKNPQSDAVDKALGLHVMLVACVEIPEP